MRRDRADRMESERLFLLILHCDTPQDVDERLRFMMRFFERAPAGQRRERPSDFFAGHILDAVAARERGDRVL